MNVNNTTKQVDLVLPCYNPAGGWESRVVTNYNQLCLLHPGYQFNLFVVTDGSVRGYAPETIAYVREQIKAFTLVHYTPNRGKGYALRTAVKECMAPAVVYIDYDFPYTWDSITNVLEALDSGADVVVAVRNRDYQRALPTFRKVLSYASHLLNRIVLRLKITDTQGGMKGFNRRGREVFLSTTINSFLFDTQFVYKATRQKMKVVAVDARIKQGIQMSVMGWKVLRRELKNVLVILFNK